MTTISAIVLTKNEERNIKECLEALRWCKEIIVVDDFSKDQTVNVAKKYGTHIYKRHLNNDFAAQRNFGLAKAQGDWVLFVDADERVSEALASEINNLQFTISNEYGGFYLKRVDVIWGKELHYGEVGNVKLLRLARKDTGKWIRRVHEYWEVKGVIGQLKNPLVHYPHQTIKEFLADIDFYSTLHAQQKYKEGTKANLLHILFWPRFKFFKNWILLRGFLDGMPGLVVALIMSFHSFLAWSKLWLLQHNHR